MIFFRSGVWHGSRKDGSSAGEDCSVWTSKSPMQSGRATLFKESNAVVLLQEETAPCDSNMAVLCVHLTQPL